MNDPHDPVGPLGGTILTGDDESAHQPTSRQGTSGTPASSDLGGKTSWGPVAFSHACWVLSGVLLGTAVGTVFQLSTATVVALALAVAATSWLVRGAVTLVAVCLVVLAGLSLMFQTTALLFPQQSWDLRWLGPCSLVATVVALLALRRAAEPSRLRPGSAMLDLSASTASLALALLLSRRLNGLGAQGAWHVVARTEDNAAWVNLVAHLRTPLGFSSLTTQSLGTFGPVVPTYLSFTRALTGGLIPHATPASLVPQIVVSSLMMLIVAAPLVAAMLVRRRLSSAGLPIMLIGWFGIAALLVSFCVVLANDGFLSASISLLLLVFAISLVSSHDPRVGPRAFLAWLCAATSLFAAAASWVPLVPLGGAAILYLCLRLLAGIPRPWRLHAAAAPLMLCLLAVMMEIELLSQYRSVAGAVGGVRGLLSATGGTPDITVALEVITIAMVGVVSFLGPLAKGSKGPHSQAATILFAIVSYFVLVLLADAWSSGDPPHYGSRKVLFILVAALLSAVIIEILASREVSLRGPGAAASIVVLVAMAGSVQQGPLYVAAQSHWPALAGQAATTQPSTAWFPAVQSAVSSGRRTLCLPLTASIRSLNEPAMVGYDCSRWASSLGGLDDQTALDWRFVLLGRQPMSKIGNDLTSATDKPWTIITCGPPRNLDNPKAWWAPLVTSGDLVFIAGGC